jgi:hypothetical protein
MNKVFLHGTCPPAKQLRYASFQHFKALALLTFSSTTSKTLSLLSLFEILKYSGDNSCTHSLQHFFKYALVFEPLRLYALPTIVVLQQFHSGCNFETSLGLHTPCMALVLNLHFYENENNVIPPEISEIKTLNPCQRTPCKQTPLHSLQEFYSFRLRNN